MVFSPRFFTVSSIIDISSDDFPLPTWPITARKSPFLRVKSMPVSIFLSNFSVLSLNLSSASDFFFSLSPESFSYFFSADPAISSFFFSADFSCFLVGDFSFSSALCSCTRKPQLKSQSFNSTIGSIFGSVDRSDEYSSI